MSRRKAAPKRIILPDPKYGNLKVAKFMNQLMTRGKKSLAESIVYGAFKEIETKLNKEPLEVFEKALDEVGPLVEVKARRVGGATYQIPLEIRPSRRLALAMRWLVNSARSRQEKTITLRLANELIEASEGKGEAMKKKEDTHRMAEANRAFSHFRF
jgi:small subunit ribosomal protein S7|tara:strand:- start:1368 stop:1838 length:471 start_codon:yes stop_codon:yes gene_type:complete